MMKSKQQENKLRVVIDTNVIISAAIAEDSFPAKIFELVLLEMIESYTSEEILDEIQQVFERPKVNRLVSEEYKSFILDNFKEMSNIVKPIRALDIVKEDPKDNMLFECASKSNAHYIISGNKHVLDVEAFENIKVKSPKDFLELVKRSQTKPESSK